MKANHPCTSCNGCGSSFDPYPSIQQALDCTNGAKAFLVQPGTYFENVNVNGNRKIHLQSLSGAGQTTIQGSSTDQAVRMAGINKTIVGFTIRNTSTGTGLALSGANMRAFNNIISGTSSSTDGGGVRITSATGQFRGNVVSQNQTSQRGGGLYLESTTIDLVDNTIENNRAGASGGGVFLKTATTDLISNKIRQNQAGFHGGCGLDKIRRKGCGRL